MNFQLEINKIISYNNKKLNEKNEIFTIKDNIEGNIVFYLKMKMKILLSKLKKFLKKEKC
jgi:hypothetical protein